MAEKFRKVVAIPEDAVDKIKMKDKSRLYAQNQAIQEFSAEKV